MSPDLELAWQRGKLDCRCRHCGAGSAATSRCYRCGSTHLDYILHGAPGWTACLGGGGAPAEKGTRDTSKARAAARVRSQDPPKATASGMVLSLWSAEPASAA